MAMSERARAVQERLLAAAEPATWKTPDDLARRAMEAVGGEELPGRSMVSTGTLHLAGRGVEGSAARMAAVGEVMTTFQRLVTAVGAAQEGYRNLRGSFPAPVLARTHLRLAASPYVGSVVLDFMPEITPAQELRPDGDIQLIDEPRTQRTDEAVSEVIGLLDAARALPADADEGPLLNEISDLGPRAAAALREFSKMLSVGDFETDVTWREPGKPTRRAILPASDAGRLSALIASRELDHGEAEVVGVLHTISDKTALAIETDLGTWEYVRGSKLPADALKNAVWGSRVRVIADAVEVRKPGGEVSVKYTAKSIQRLDEV
ncbi:hypothetical protein [Isoptericola sp. NPDC058082]|uniref:hypothetical protein n=1 Tax=Isoptericola sp. NPDC058082 TaxID=3346331 RepID=UPI0036E2D4B0